MFHVPAVLDAVSSKICSGSKILRMSWNWYSSHSQHIWTFYLALTINGIMAGAKIKSNISWTQCLKTIICNIKILELHLNKCYLESLVYFVLLPWIVGYIQVPFLVMFPLAIIGLIIIIIYAPSATKKQPVPKRLRKGKRIKAISVTLLLLIISIFLNEPYQQLMLLGIIIISILQLPIFFPKEDG